jgi:hypothetical protein
VFTVILTCAARRRLLTSQHADIYLPTAFAPMK